MKLFRYTVIEMIAVISIGAVLMAVSVPAFSHLLRGNAPGMAARELMGKLASARSYAAANRTYVALVFPELGNTSIPEKFRAVTYRLCEVNQSLQFQKWLDNWNQLPQGIVVQQLNAPSGYNSSSPLSEAEKGSGTVTRTITNCKIDDMTGGTGTNTCSFANAIVFTPRGLPFNNDAVRIPIEMGTVSGTTFTPTNGYSNLCVPLVIRATGKVKFFDTLVAP